MQVRCVSCGKLFDIPSTQPSGKCPYCNDIRKLTWVSCTRCSTEFGIFNKCNAVCISCGYIHSCGEIEIIERKDE